MLVVALKFAASTVAAILSTATIHNVVETFSVCSPSNNSNIFKDPSSILNHYLQQNYNNNDDTENKNDTKQKIGSRKRKPSILSYNWKHIYFCEIPLDVRSRR